MSDYTLTALARADIFDIWSFIAEDNEDAADRVERAIYDSCKLIAEGPMLGHSRPDLTLRGLRFWDAHPISELRDHLQGRDKTDSNRCGYTWQTEYSSNSEAAAVVTSKSRNRFQGRSPHQSSRA